MSHLCSCGLLAALELLVDVPELDVNLPDKDGNTPLILAAQAGHTSTVRFLLQDFKGIRIDQANRLGMTALIKAAIQGRTDCSRLLLYAGADPKFRDQGRKLCAQEWAAYCGRRECADTIAKFSNTKSFYLKSREAERAAGQLLLERSNSLPDLAKDGGTPNQKPQHKRASLRKKIKKILPGNTNDVNGSSSNNTLSVNPGSTSPFAVIARCVSTPVIPGAMHSGTGGNPASSLSSTTSSNNLSNGILMKRPVSVDNIPRVEVTHPPKDECGAENFGYPPGSGGRTLRSKRRQYFNSCDTIITHINTAPSTTKTYSTSGSGSGGGGAETTSTTTTTTTNSYNTPVAGCQSNNNTSDNRTVATGNNTSSNKNTSNNNNNNNNGNNNFTTTSTSPTTTTPLKSSSSSSSSSAPSSTTQQSASPPSSSSSSSSSPPSSSSSSKPQSSDCKERVSVT